MSAISMRNMLLALVWAGSICWLVTASRPAAALVQPAARDQAATANGQAVADQPGVVKLVIARKFGYVIGDLIRYEAVVTVDPSWHLRAASLPSPGRPEYWLELRAVDSDESHRSTANVYHVRLLYQTFYAPIEARTRTLPGFALTFDHGGGTNDILVPPLTVTMSPLREVATGTGDPEQNVALMPDRQAIPQSLRVPTVAIAVGLVLSLSLGSWVAWRRSLWPFSRRPGRPFARAARRLRGSKSDESADYAAALLAIHRAFDAAAGWRVFASDQPRFFAQYPRFRAAAADIERFFSASRQCFFAGDTVGAHSALPPPALRKLASHLASVERTA